MDTRDRRQKPRKKSNFVAIAAIGTMPPSGRDCTGRRFRYVDVYDYSDSGASFRTNYPIEVNKQFFFTMYSRSQKGWSDHIATVRWSAADKLKMDHSMVGVRLIPFAEGQKWHADAGGEKKGPLPSDYEFFRTVPFLRAIHREAVSPLLNNIIFRSVKAGERFITQGEAGDRSYIVQKGECRVVIEKHGQLHPVARIQKGEFVGEMALLTGEPRSAHVIATCDMALWEISKKLFETMVRHDPEVSTFLTEIMSERFSTRSMTADRSIGKYTITDIIGRGGYSIVYRAVHMDLNRPAAIKMLKHDMALNDEFLSKFRGEAQMIASFSNENIVKIYDIEECYRTVFIIMELLEGRPLNELIADQGRLELQDTVAVIHDVCKGLRYAHHRGIVHQDIKPGNIFITTDGTAKVLDFGLAAPWGSEHFMVGTPFYMSPEQVECLPVDGRSDIYSLGLTAFEMVTGRRPFEAENAHTAMNLHVERDILDPGDLVPNLNGDLRGFIVKACARNPEDRYADIESAMGAIEPLAHQRRAIGNNKTLLQQKVKTLFLFYREHQEQILNDLLEDFTNRIKSRGMDLKT